MNRTTVYAPQTKVTRALTSGGVANVRSVAEASPSVHEAPPPKFRDIVQSLNVSAKDASNLELYHRASEESGGKVIMDQQHGYLPVLIGSDGNLIPLYKFVEVIDEITDYEHLRQEFPTLSFGQVASAIGFLRKLAQFNTRNIDIDAVEDLLLEDDPDFQVAIRASLEDQEDMRVRTLE